MAGIIGFSTVLLLTGATGLVGTALLRRLIGAGTPVRCLVRDPRRLGSDRVRVQIALGDLGDPASFRHALRGVHTVVHLAAAERDQPHASVEELAGLATWRLLRGAERAGVRRFLFMSCLGAAEHHVSRVHRAKALAEQAVRRSPLVTTTVASSLVYAPEDRRLRGLEHLALAPVVPLTGLGRARAQPLWADDAAACLHAILRHEATGHDRVELAGPETVTHREFVERILRAVGRPRPLAPVPLWAVKPLLRAYETAAGPTAVATWDQVRRWSVTMTTPRGTADAESLGVTPRPMADVL